MISIKLNAEISVYPWACPLNCGWILPTFASYVKVTPDGNFTHNPNYVLTTQQDRKIHALYKSENKIVKRAINNDGEIVELEDAEELECNHDFSYEIPSILSTKFKRWLGIKDKETGVLFTNEKDKREIFLSLPIGNDSKARIVFSKDGLTAIVFKAQSKEIFILDNPVL